MSKKPRKVRVDFRKNRQPRARRNDWTRKYDESAEQLEAEGLPSVETVRAKGDQSRRRTILVDADQVSSDASNQAAQPGWQFGRVLSVTGNWAEVETADGNSLTCAISRVLRTLSIDSRSTVVAGDCVQFRLSESVSSGPDISEPQGMIERVETRRGVLARAYRQQEQIVASNVDQLLIVSALAEPGLKLNLIDRYIVAAHHGEIRPVICLNKADLVDLAPFQAIIGLYSQLGYDTVITSAQTGLGIRRLRAILRGRETILAGQSGVGKSSLLNAVEPELGLRVNQVSQATLHGRHTTTIAKMYRLRSGGWVVDTPGVRQYELWRVNPQELEGYFIEFRPYIASCRFPNCTHTHEVDCAIKNAVASGEIDAGRYERYLNLFAGNEGRKDVQE